MVRDVLRKETVEKGREKINLYDERFHSLALELQFCS